MKKITSLVLTLLMLLVCTALPCASIGQQAVIKYGTPAIDGNIEKLWLSANRMRLTNITDGDDYRGRLPGLTSAYVSAMWDEEALYFLFELYDDDFTFGASGQYRDDCVNIFIDELDLYGETWGEGQRQIRLVPSGSNPIQIVHGDEPQYSQIGYRFDGDCCIIEYKYVPTDFVIAEGARLLIDFSFEDVNEDGGLSYRFTWSDEIGEGELDSSNWSYLCIGTSGSVTNSDAAGAAEALGVIPISDYIFVKGTNGNPNESADKLWDGDVQTKFCTGEFPAVSTVRCEQKYYVTGVLMATANDTKEYTGRNPNSWKIEGSNDGEGWSVIISGDDTFFENLNFTYFSTTVDCEEAYSYFRFSTNGADSGCFQLSEVTICGTTVKDGVNANTDKEALAEPIVPGGTIVEQISHKTKSDANDVNEVSVEDNDSEGKSILLLCLITVVLILAVVIISSIQSCREKAEKKNSP